MIKDELKKLNIEMQIDSNIEKTKNIINEVTDYIIEDIISDINQDKILEQLEDAEYMLKKSLELIAKLAEIYENTENKNS